MDIMNKRVAKWKENFRKKEEDSIRLSFAVVEMDGDLWLTHYGVAFKKLNKDTSAENVSKYLNQARNTAIEFEKL